MACLLVYHKNNKTFVFDTEENMLSISHYSKSYDGKKDAVHDLSFEVRSGDIFGFIGHNGAGKTTTIKSCAGILEFSRGTITIDGVDIKKDPVSCKKKTAYLPDNPDIYEFMSGIKYLNFIGDIFDDRRSPKIPNAFYIGNHFVSAGFRQKRNVVALALVAVVFAKVEHAQVAHFRVVGICQVILGGNDFHFGNV